MECDTGDVGGVTVEGEDRIGIRGLDVVKLDRMVTGGGEVSLVGRDAKAVDLGVWVWDSPGAYTGERFPESRVLGVSTNGCQ